MESLHPKSNRIICIIALLALNVGVLMLIAETRIPLEEISAQQNKGGANRGDLPMGMSGYRFPSCSGDSVNCHTRGNIAGL